MSLRVYGDSISGNCLKVKWVADFLGIPYVWTETSVVNAETRTPEFLTLNPAGQVPMIILEDGRPLAQSNAIIGWMARDSVLVPADPYDHARMMEWLFWEQYSHEPYVAVARFHMHYMGKTREEIGERIYERGAAALKRMDDALQGGGFLVGQAVSLADVALVAYTRVAHEGGFDLSDYPAVTAWVARVEAALGIV
ncbi:glutathione S-transferase family protein [Caulobacter segnis]|uniref:glutathione S-transferase family protein n=1 Tax=Caulobacter segnis TaxID=88688 RepID=UPI00240F2173|nr:glutathione S-transferase family protein [Caulobacter segnis]MDG2522546.1 glutathione S-transferase family protein [Caulobacter segnis]